MTLGLQTFIDQLIEDKKSISQKAESIAVEMRTTERRNRENVKAMESRHSLEMGRIKQVAFHQELLTSLALSFRSVNLQTDLKENAGWIRRQRK